MKNYATCLLIKNIFIFFAGFVFTNCSAQWVCNGPYGGRIQCMANVDSSIFAGTIGGAGIFRTDDNAATWQPANNGIDIPGIQFYAMVVTGDTLYAGGDHGVYASTDFGNSWVQLNNGLPDYVLVDALVIKGSNIFAGTDVGLFASNNNGNSWTPSDSALMTNNYIRSLAISDSDLFAGSDGYGVYLSANNGISWIQVNTGLTSTDISALLIAGDKIFAGTNAGVFYSINNGASWTPINGVPANDEVNALFADSNKIYAGTRNSGVFVSDDSGNTWLPASGGIPQSSPVQYPSVQAFVSTKTGLFTGTDGKGAFIFNNDSSNWTPSNYGLNNLWISSVAVCNSRIFAGTETEGVLSSNDNGASWNATNYPAPMNDIRALAVRDTTIFACPGIGFYLSNNNGASWIATDSLFYLPSGEFAIAVNDSIICISSLNQGVYISFDGSTWSADNSGLTSLQLSTIAIDSNNIYVGTYDSGVFVSSNYGQSWSHLTLQGLPNPPSINAFTFLGGYVYVASNGVFRASNGNSWQKLNDNDSIWSLAIYGDYIFAGNATQGVSVSTDSGYTWNDLRMGLPYDAVPSLAVKDSVVYAATTSNSVWQRNINEVITSLEKTTGKNLNGFSLYPNPASSNFTIETNLTGSQQLQLFDLTGQLLLSQTIENSKTTIDASSLAAGVYLVSLKSSNGVSTQKLIITR